MIEHLHVDDWAAGATIAGLGVPGLPDLARMRRERHRRLQEQLELQELDGLVLLGTSSVAYASGAEPPGEDAGRAGLFRTIAVVVRGADAPHLFTPYWDAAPADLPSDHLHGPLFADLDDGIGAVGEALGALFSGAPKLGTDELTHPMRRALAHVAWSDANRVLGPCKLLKTPDEISCVRLAQRTTELAMEITRRSLRPGLRQTDLTGTFLRRVFELGATSNSIDPIWQVMTATLDEGPWTIHGGLAFPLSTTDRVLREGDVIWVDAGISHHGYASDYGRTWITARHPTPTPRQTSQFHRWRAVVDACLAVCKPGASALDLGRAAIAANGGERPWIEHFYLAHGVGTDSAEMPLIGTDLGESFDEALVMAPGMVLVFEPVIWDEGASGYRAEDVVAVTDTGWVPLSSSRYDPFEAPA
ncbi:MAG: M24 family metallopeptidase [Acidimicrobiales bacterium]